MSTPMPDGLIATPVSAAASAPSSDLYQAMFEGLRQIVWLLRPDGTVERFNPFWAEYTGLPDRIEGLAWANVFHRALRGEPAGSERSKAHPL